MSVVLASTSRTRATLLQAAGVRFEAVAPGVDEDAAKAGFAADGLRPRDVADALAELKALKVSARHPDALVIGCDQTGELEGRLLDKPADAGAGRGRLLELRGRTHSLHSAVVVARGGAAIWRQVASARLTVRDFSQAFLNAHVAEAGEALTSSPTAYWYEGVGVQLFSRVEGDHATILGLPLLGLLDLLRRHGELIA